MTSGATVKITGPPQLSDEETLRVFAGGTSLAH
jgi:hypothetical protein